MELARLYGDLGDQSKEEEFYDRLGSTPPFVAILPDMAQRDMKRGRFIAAEGLYRQGIRIFEDRGDRGREAAMFDGLAAACEKENKPQEAAAAREKAKSLRGSTEGTNQEAAKAAP